MYEVGWSRADGVDGFFGYSGRRLMNELMLVSCYKRGGRKGGGRGELTWLVKGQLGEGMNGRTDRRDGRTWIIMRGGRDARATPIGHGRRGGGVTPRPGFLGVHQGSLPADCGFRQ